MTDTPLKPGTVALVGAGPGDPGLITLRGRDWLERADVVVYDYLANKRLLRFTPDHVETIYAGKKEGVVTLTQTEISQLLVDKAKQGKTVVRLKGGDPFLFGRGGEEASKLAEAGIPFVIVPGVASPVGVSAYAGIPLTHRDCSSTVSIITGSNEKGNEDLHLDWEKIASRSGTLVFLMGARKLKRIAAKLMEHGKSPETPIAVVQWGTTFKQKTWKGTLQSIIGIADREKIAPPALTIVGEVVDQKLNIDWFETLPLFGKSVVVTRAGNQADSFIEQLYETGAEPLSFPVIEMVEPDDTATLDEAMQNLGQYHGVIFTSVNGVRWFMKRLMQHELDIRELKGVRVYCIGPKTGQEVEDLGIRVDLVPEEFVAESLIEYIGQENISGKRFLLPRAQIAREVLPDELRKLGAEVDVAPAYKTVLPDTDISQLKERLQAGTIDIVTFTSSSTVKNFVEMIGPELKDSLEKVTLACIGPVTAKTAENMGLTVGVQAKEYTVDGLLTAMESHFQNSST